MSGKWATISQSKTSETQYTIAKLEQTGNTNDQVLSDVQATPTTDPPTTNATTVPFNVEGCGHGVTISYLVSAGTDVKVVLDINNDPSFPPDNSLWVATNATHTGGTGGSFLASKNSYRTVRLRLESGGAGRTITQIRLMSDS